jgi:hypothetical protein
MIWFIFSVGYVLEKKSGGKDKQNLDDEVCDFVSCAEFQNITYWNHDTTSSAEDPLPRCFHWLTVADAVSTFDPPKFIDPSIEQLMGSFLAYL